MSLHFVTSCIAFAKYSTFLLVTPAIEMRPSRESLPKANSILLAQNSGRPAMGAYSLCNCFSTILASAQRTQGSTQGLPQSSRYAPTPRLRRLGFLSRLNASVTPRIGSGGPISTSSNQALPRLFKPSGAIDCKTRPVGRKFKMLTILVIVHVNGIGIKG
uniref:Uncharacterized protein n=1 Tax=Glossina pallidipes TaxID=7398 RepID=A0A1A9ZTS5_GLOPL